MDVREKLAELIKDSIRKGLRAKGDDRLDYSFEDVADHLIANGVTVQEWISVSEHPKEYRDEYGELIPFLVCEEGTDYPFRAMYDGKTWGDGIFAIPVKWWMHLPAPPKEMDEPVGNSDRLEENKE